MTNLTKEKELNNNEYDLTEMKKQKELNELLSTDNIFKKEYLKFCNYLEEYDKLSNTEGLKLNAAIVYRYNYQQIIKLKSNLQSDEKAINETILDYLLLVGNKDLRSISISANYLLDGEIISKIYSLSRMKDFESFKEKLITIILFRTIALRQKVDVNELITGLLKYRQVHPEDFHHEKPKVYRRVRA